MNTRSHASAASSDSLSGTSEESSSEDDSVVSDEQTENDADTTDTTLESAQKQLLQVILQYNKMVDEIGSIKQLKKNRKLELAELYVQDKRLREQVRASTHDLQVQTELDTRICAISDRLLTTVTLLHHLNGALEHALDENGVLRSTAARLHSAANAAHILELDTALASAEAYNQVIISGLETALATAKTHNESRVLHLETALASAKKYSESRVSELDQALATAQTHSESRVSELETALASANTTSESRVLELETAMATAWALSESRVVELETALATAKTHSESRVLELETALATAWAPSESRVVELETALAFAKTHSESRVSELETAMVSAKTHSESRVFELETALATAKTHSESRILELEMALASAEAHCQAKVLELESAPGLASAARVSEHQTAAFPTPESVQHTLSSTENQLVARKAELCELKAQSTTVCNEMQAELQRLAERIQSLKQEEGRICQGNDTAQAEKHTRSCEILSHEQHIATLEKNKYTLQSEHENLQAQYQVQILAFDEALDELTGRYEYFEQMAGAVCAQLMLSHENRQMCEHGILGLQEARSTHEQSIRVLESVKNDNENKILESKKELRIIHQCYSENKALCADKQSQHDTVSAHLLALGVDVETKQTELRACQDECMKLQDVIIEKNVHICELDKVLQEKNETLHIVLQGVADDNGKLEAMAKLHQIQSANNMQAIQHQESLLANAHTEVLQATTRQDELVKEIELLMVSFRDYTGKLQKVQTYTHALSDACLLVKNKFTPGAADTPVPEHITILHILELLENFVSWFEFTYNSRLYEFTCILSQSELE